ncbi:alkyl sulfatase dimerization domain-containing protein [Roseibium sp. RKSG952]|uniref:alkyl sulfatase dimerization domain-containing protein n=1 Tax=Roseibium sp. RKSG952 TaxID=2529384 RepID=UPI0012BC120A|nr:alkyl sulfatase dimerization domain-containing protein [Roseibium sp. RKSG952]MTI00433.1 MBL fold metallo-hydrolase [Roseibium sp. RKSG952]
MNRRYFLAGFASGVVLTGAGLGAGGYAWLKSGGGGFERKSKAFAQVADVTARPDVAEHTKIFEKRVEEPAPGVYVAIGYGLANVVMIEAPDGLIMVDTLESIRAAEGLLPWVNDLRARTGKDITDIIYTHNHADHVFGAGVFVESQETAPRIWAQVTTEDRVHEVINVLAPITAQRAMRMFGNYLPDDVFSNNGIGPRLLNDDQDGIFFVAPTDIIGEYLEVNIAGETVVIEHAPGETSDQLMIYLPERKVLLPADNYYHAFPNLYTIRGTPYRDPRLWAESIDKMRRYDAEVMVPHHSAPVYGAEVIEEQLRNYRDAIQYVYDATIRMINEGLTPDDIAERIKLPPHLANAPYLQEFYGRVEWSARSIFSGTLGWFSGDPVDLLPVPRQREAELMADMAGGTEGMVAAARKALDTGEPSWALKLASQLERLQDENAVALKVEALRALAAQETSSSGRNYFLTSAAEAEGFQIPGAVVANTPDEVIYGIPIRNFLSALTVNVKSEELLDQEVAYGFGFTDDRPLTVRIRRGISFVEDGLADDRIGTLVTTTDTFAGMAVGRLNPAKLLLSGDMEVEGSISDLNAFLGHFNPPV